MPMPRPEIKPDPRHDSGASRLGLNAANFFQAESVGVVMPVLNGYLRSAGWAFSSIGIATAIAGLGALLFQTPAGLLTDRINFPQGAVCHHLHRGRNVLCFAACVRA